MPETQTLPDAQTTTIEEQFNAFPETEVDPKDWPLGSQTTYLYSRTTERTVFARMILQPMEPFRSATIRYRFDVGQLPNNLCLAFAQPRGGKAVQLKEGVNHVEFPSQQSPLFVFIQAGGPVGSAVVVTMGEQRQC